MDRKERYLSNPHITLNEKNRKKLGIDTQEFDELDLDQDIEIPGIALHHEVLHPKKRYGRPQADDSTEV